MPAPTAYTEAELIAYMQGVIGPDVRAALNWQAPEDYEQIVWSVQRMLGLDSIESASDMVALEAAARYAVWDAVVRHSVAWHDISTDGQSLSLSQVHDHAVAQRNAAALELGRLGAPGFTATIGVMQAVYTDPYQRIVT